MTAQQLKNSILQMAVQGKLVPQDPNDEPASVLLERIRAEKEQLIKQKKIKREKNSSVIFKGADNTPYEKIGNGEPVSLVDDIPFEIPDSWEWVRLGDIFWHNTGKALNASNRKGTLLPYITTSNLYWNRFELGELREMYFTDEEIEKCTASKGDLLVCEGGDIGRAAIWPFDYDIRIQNHIHRLRPFTTVDVEYFYYLFYLYKHVGWIGGKGIGIQGLSANALHALLFPLPPFAEQKRIVAKIKEIEPYTDRYTAASEHIEKLNSSFPEKLKKSILQMAVQGKLVPQDASDEPASLLLDRIRAEKETLIKTGKIKRDKHESVIFRRDNSHYEKLDGIERCIDDEIPFEIPENWSWIRLSQLATKIGAGSTPTGGRAVYLSEGIKFIRSQNVYNDGLRLNDIAYISDETNQKKSGSIVCPKDILLNITGGSIGRCAIVPDDFDVANVNQHVMIIRLIDPQLRIWIHTVLISEYVQNMIMDVQVGVSREGLSATKLMGFLIPIPPAAEQNRIMKRIHICTELL